MAHILTLGFQLIVKNKKDRRKIRVIQLLININYEKVLIRNEKII